MKVEMEAEALEAIKLKMQEQDALVRQLTEPPLAYASVVAFHQDKQVTLAYDGSLVRVIQPEKFKLKVGDIVIINAQMMSIVNTTDIEPSGQVGIYIRKINADTSEVEIESSSRIVFTGKAGKNPEVGDQIVLDRSGFVIINNLGKDAETFKIATDLGVSWDDIGGLEEAKITLREIIELPHSNPEILSFYGRKPAKGVLLFGPPGCGKTMLGKATAGSLAKIYKNASANTGFMYIKGPEILDKYVGVAEARIREIFARANKHKRIHGYPAVIFIDEADAILGRRGAGISSDIERTTVPMFLTEMDGLEETGAIVILSTNRPDTLDPAIVRDGRIDHKIRIGRPLQKEAVDIFALYIKKVPVAKGSNCTEMAEMAATELYNPNRLYYRITTVDKESYFFRLEDFVNGGMIANAVNRAANYAIRRDLDKKTKTGVRIEDIRQAINAIDAENREVNHYDDIVAFSEQIGQKIVDVVKIPYRVGENA